MIEQSLKGIESMRRMVVSVVLAGSGVLVGGTPALAQSSVTLYGALDAGLGYFGDRAGADGASGASVQMQSGNISPNLWGIKGTEDLGGGFKSIFKIESGFNINNGRMLQGGRLFGRTAMVGLSGESSGTLTVGRQYDPLIDLIQPLTNDGTFGSAFATPGDMDNYDNSFRTGNALKYTTPNLRGLQAAAMYALGGQPGGSAGRTYAFAAAYRRGPFGVGAGYFYAHSANGSVASFDGLHPNTDVDTDSPAVSGGFVSANSLQIARAAARYQMGRWIAGLSYSNVRYNGYATPAGGVGSTAFNTFQGYLDFHLSAATVVGVGYDTTRGAGNRVDVRYDQWSLGADYHLSALTDVYALAGYQHASGQTIDAATGMLVPAVASMADFGNDANTDRQFMAIVGMRHVF
ncbi:porin [Burkholderia ambifaria]|nr:porin [Burkholderia ambifaria]